MPPVTASAPASTPLPSPQGDLPGIVAIKSYLEAKRGFPRSPCGHKFSKKSLSSLGVMHAYFPLHLLREEDDAHGQIFFFYLACIVSVHVSR